jgi:hypothetical protein
MRIGWKHRASLGIFVLCFIAQSSARKIESHDLLIGDWNTTLRCSRSWFSKVFPPPDASEGELSTRRGQWETPRNFHCRLSLYPNGTFGFEPREVTAMPPVFSVHGRWTVKINPYCVTDRFYDELVLEAYPRVQKKLEDGKETIIQKVKVKLQCRLSGHFTGDRLRFKDRDQFARGKLTHGVLVFERNNDESKKTWWHRPRIAASFSASRLIPSWTALASQVGDDDQEESGY